MHITQERISVSAINKRIEFVLQSIAPTLLTSKPGREYSAIAGSAASSGQRLVAEWIDTATLRERMRHQHMQTFHLIGHAATRERGSQRPRSHRVCQIRVVRTTVGGGKIRIPDNRADISHDAPDSNPFCSRGQ